MKFCILGVSLLSLLANSGCKYFTPPVTNISGADVEIEKKAERSSPDATKSRKVKITVNAPSVVTRLVEEDTHE